MPRSPESGARWPTWSVGPDGFYGSGWGETIDWEAFKPRSDDPKQACKTFEAGFSPPAYSEDDIEVTDVTYVNDKATAIVGGGDSALTSGGEEITSKYSLVLDGETWKINAAEID